MVKSPRSDRAARKAGRKEVGPRKRLVYLKARTVELKTELKKLAEERKSLQAQFKAEKASKVNPEDAA